MDFLQQPPELPNTFRADRPLREHLERLVPAERLAAERQRLDRLGADAAGELAELAWQAEQEPPTVQHYEPWGRRVDLIHESEAWRRMHLRQLEEGLCHLPYRDGGDAADRIVQHAAIHLYAPSSAIYTCPVAMTDAAVRVLLDHADPELRDRVVPRLTSTDPSTAWTSGQWMTERAGGSDVGRTETVARRDAAGTWRLHGVKWFTSATTADCALALARPEGAEEGSRGLSLMLVEMADPDTGERRIGREILVNRLKDKLGTKALPTAELTLDGVPATPVGDLGHGVRKIAGMLNLTRWHNSTNAVAGMRRGLDLALSFSQVREAFGAPIVDQPLHRATLADLQVEYEAMLALTLRASQLLGLVEHGEADDDQRAALRGILPLVKLVTGRDAVAHAAESVEVFGGNGYVEDTGMPALLRNAHVLPLWEGTTNVLALDLLRATVREDALAGLLADLDRTLAAAGDHPGLADPARRVAAERDRLAAAAGAWPASEQQVVQAGMRTFALRLGRALAAAQLVGHAAHRLDKHGDDRAARVARRYAERWLRDDPAPLPGSADELDEALGLLDLGEAGEA